MENMNKNTKGPDTRIIYENSPLSKDIKWMIRFRYRLKISKKPVFTEKLGYEEKNHVEIK